MKTITKHALYWSVASSAIGLVTPALVILWLEVFVGHISPLASIADILERQISTPDDETTLFLYNKGARSCAACNFTSSSAYR